MTRVCMDCPTVLGEKCPHCGREVQPGLISSDGGYCCRFCLKFSKTGDGGATHGLCEPCRQKRHAELAAAEAGK